MSRFTKKAAEKAARALAKELGKGWKWEVGRSTVSWGRTIVWTPRACNGVVTVEMSAFSAKSYWASVSMKKDVRVAYKSSTSPRAAVRAAAAAISKNCEEAKKRSRILVLLSTEADYIVKKLYKRGSK